MADLPRDVRFLDICLVLGVLLKLWNSRSMKIAIGCGICAKGI